MTMRSNIDSELVAAISLSPEQLLETGELRVGYMPEVSRFEVIIRYHGELEDIIERLPGVYGEKLTEQYAILILSREEIEEIATWTQVEYVEKPKALLPSDLGALRESCITTVQLPQTFGLHGRGTCVGIMDSGIDYLHPAFITEGGESRIAALWDQTLGEIYTKEEITAAIQASQTGGREAAYRIVPSRDALGHGTQVAGIAAGNGRGSDGTSRGVADEAELVVVKLTENQGYGFTKTTSVMRALKYIIETARELTKPVAVNISMGTNIGGHDGQSLFETYIDDWSRRWINSIVVAAGNERAAGRHTGGMLKEGEWKEIEIHIGEGRQSVMFQIWKEYADRLYINVGSPNGQNSGFVREGSGIFQTVMDGTRVLVYFGEPNPYSASSTIYINLFSGEGVAPGLWRIYLLGEDLISGRYDIWMTGTVSGRGNTYFLVPEEDTTITMPVTARTVIGVGAYNHMTGAIAPFSSRGYSRNDQIISPDLVAPGVDVLTTVPGGGYGLVSGTSMAAPFVSGSAALMMEWGIVQGRDVFLYGERLRAMLMAGADRNFGDYQFPNRDWGYGKLCLFRTMRDLANQNLNGQIAMARAEETNCREAAMSEDYVELVFQRRSDGTMPMPVEDPICFQEISNRDILVFVRVPEFESSLSVFSFFSWENIPVLYGLAADETALDAMGITDARDLLDMPLDGTGVRIGIVDTGIDYLHPCFRYENGSSKIVSIWDQEGMDGEPPADSFYGREYTREEIETAIRAQEAGEDPYAIVAERDLNGHGTYIAGVAAGRRDSQQGFSGAAPEAELIIVKLKQAKRVLRRHYGVPEDAVCFQHTDIQQGISYLVKKAEGHPLVVLLALSSNFGPHDGNSKLEQAIDSYQRQPGMIFVGAGGNQGDTAMHTSGQLAAAAEVEFYVGEGERALLLTAWMKVPDQFSLSMTTPRGYEIERIPRGIGIMSEKRIPIENTTVSVEYIQGTNWNGEQGAVIRLENPTAGLWRIQLYGDSILNGRYDIYMPLRQWTRPDTRFLSADPERTVTMPGTAGSILTIGGYQHLTQSLYPPSGRGPTRQEILKPDLVAPAVGIFGPVSPEGYQERNGTSAAAALAAGGTAQLLQWAIKYGNSPNIGSAGLKAMLYRGSIRRTEILYPNNRWGYGQMNVFQSIEKS